MCFFEELSSHEQELAKIFLGLKQAHQYEALTSVGVNLNDLKKIKTSTKLKKLPDPDKDEYMRIEPYSKDDPVAFLEKHWGEWLQFFNKELKKLNIDLLSQAQLRKRDRRLMRRLEHTLSPSELAKIIPTHHMICEREYKDLQSNKVRLDNFKKNRSLISSRQAKMSELKNLEENIR